MNILHIISSGGMYGAEAVILTLCRTLGTGPHRCALGVFSNSLEPNLQLHEAALAAGIESHQLSCSGQFDLSVPAQIRELARRTDADIVHAHGYKADVYVYFAMRGSRTPVVSTCHTWYDNDLRVRLYGALDRFLLRTYAGVAAVSEEVRQRLLHAGVRDHRIALVRNGINLDQLLRIDRTGQRPENPPDSGLTVGLVGRLAPEKGVDLFLRAAAIVLRELPFIRFVVVGDGPDRAQLTTLIDQLGIGQSASLRGRCEDMPSFYASLDLMVSASRQEGLPIAILEGMGSGLPLVATAVGEVPSVVHDGITGALVAPENVNALAHAITASLNNPGQRRQFGAAGRTLIADQFSASCMSAHYLAFYEHALSPHAEQDSLITAASPREKRL